MALLRKGYMVFEFYTTNRKSQGRSLTVPDYPYTKEFTRASRYMHRIAFSPLEWEGAAGDLAAFWESLPEEMKRDGIDHMLLSDETGDLMRWNHVTVAATVTPYGLALEVETTEDHIRYAN